MGGDDQSDGDDAGCGCGGGATKRRSSDRTRSGESSDRADDDREQGSTDRNPASDRSNGDPAEVESLASTGTATGPTWLGSGPARRPADSLDENWWRTGDPGDAPGTEAGDVSPTLDGRDAGEIRSTLADRAPYYTGEDWGPGAGGVGSGLLELFAGMAEEVIERVDRLPEKHRRAFVDELGFDRLPPQAARVPVTLSVSEGADGPVGIPSGTRVLAEPDAEDVEELTFELEEGFSGTPASLDPVIAVDPDLDHVATHPPEPGADVDLFGGENDQDHRLYLGHPELLALPAGSRIRISLETTAPQSWLYGLKWEYFGEHPEDSDADPEWRGLEPAPGSPTGTLPGPSGEIDRAAIEAVLARNDNRLVTDDDAELEDAELERWLTKQAIHGGPLADYAGDDRALPPGGQPRRSDGDRTRHTLEFDLPAATKAAPLEDAADFADLGGLEEVESCWVRCAIPQDVVDAPPAARRHLFAIRVSNLAIGGGRLAGETETRSEGSSSRRSDNSSTEAGDGGLPGEFAHSPDALFANDVPLAVPGNSSDDEDEVRPFGRMPRRRDVFYLADDEAFTKSDQLVGVKFRETAGGGDDDHPPVVSWEYWNGDGWTLLPLEADLDLDSDTVANTDDDLTFRTEPAIVAFEVPDDFEPTEVAGHEHHWIRARLVDGGYGDISDFVDITDDDVDEGTLREALEGDAASILTGTWQRIEDIDEPSFSGITVGYPPVGGDGDSSVGRFDRPVRDPIREIRRGLRRPEPFDASAALSGPSGAPEHILTENNLAPNVEDPSARIQPFRGPADDLRAREPGADEQALYFGFDGELDGGPFQLYLSLSDVTYPPSFSPRVRWEAYTDAGWEPLSVRDGTEGLRESGILRFSPPDATVAHDRFGDRRHWIRARVRAPGGFALEPYAPVRSGEDGETGKRRCSTSLSTSPPGSGPHRQRPELSLALSNSGMARNARSVSGEILGSSDGTPDQSFVVDSPPAREPELWVEELSTLSEAARASLSAASGVDVRREGSSEDPDEFWVRWEPVEDLLASGPDDRHFAFDRVTGRVTFGDGRHGDVPSTGRENLRISYVTGGGAPGNVGAGAVSDLQGSIAFVEEVRNAVPADGGADAEATASVLDRAGRKLRDRNRAVGPADFERIARGSARIVERVRCLPGLDEAGTYRPGWVTVLIVPRTGNRKPKPSATLTERVVEGLEKRAPASLGGGIPDGRLVVRGPAYVEASVTATLQAADVSSLAAVEESAETALAEYLHPVTGGDEGEGWPFGELPCVSDFTALLERLEGVDHVVDLSIEFRSNGDERIVGMGQEPPEVAPDVLVHAGAHDVQAEGGL